MASSDMTLHIELSGLDRDLLERVCENLEWYRKHLQEQAQMMFAHDQAQKRQETERREAEQEAEKSVRYDDWGIPIQGGEIG